MQRNRSHDRYFIHLGLLQGRAVIQGIILLSEAEKTIVGSYTLVKTVTGGTTTSAPTAFPFGVTSGDMNLLEANYGGVADETRAYRVEILITGKPAGTGRGLGGVRIGAADLRERGGVCRAEVRLRRGGH